MRAVCYLRYSCTEQADGFSLDAQRHSTHTFIQQRGWTLVREYVDEAHSAKANAPRPAYKHMMAGARQHLFDVIVVDKVDRFYRHLKGLLTSLDELNSLSVTFVSVKENLDFTTPWGKIALTIMGILAEVYIDNLRQETRKGKVARARKGLWNGKIPFGYCKGICSKCADPNGGDPDGRSYCPNFGQADLGDGKNLVVHPIESEAVRLAFEWYAAGDVSDRDVATRLNATPFVLPDGSALPFRTKGKIGGQPAPISTDAVRSMLSRPFYIGLVPYGGTDEHGKRRRRNEIKDWHSGQQPVLVDKETFERVQELRRIAKHRYGARNGTHPLAAHPLSGILVCATCGRPLRAMTNNGFRYYRDTSRLDGVGECDQPTLRAEAIEEQVTELLVECQHCLPADWRERLEAHWVEEHPDAAEQVRQVKAQLERATELYVEGLIGKERLHEKQMAYHVSMSYLRTDEISAILSLGHRIEHFDALWQEAQDLTTKNGLLRLILEVAHVQGYSLIAVQPTVAMLPLLVLCRNGDDGCKSIQV